MRIVLVREGDKYGPEYIRLFDPFDPVVLPLRYGWRGWWAKMELFAPENAALRPCLYVDLDSIIFDFPELSEPEVLMMPRDWGRDGANSSVMLIPRNVDAIWRKWIARPQQWMDQYAGDQNFLERQHWQPIEDAYPDLVGSYKRSDHNKHIVTFHGRPKPHECDGWAGEIWQARTS